MTNLLLEVLRRQVGDLDHDIVYPGADDFVRGLLALAEDREYGGTEHGADRLGGRGQIQEHQHGLLGHGEIGILEARHGRKEQAATKNLEL